MPLFLGVDCGTQSLKVIAWDSDSARVVDSAQVAYPLIEGLPPGHKEQHPQTWIDALESCMARLKSRGKAPLAGVAAIGVSGQQHGFVPLDSSDKAIRAAKLWCDTSTEPECAALLRAAGGLQAAIAETGNGIPSGFTISKVRWLKDHEPENYRRLAWILLPHDYLNLYLTGQKTAECGDASGSGFFDVRRRSWSDKALAWIDPNTDLRDKLPALIQSAEPAGTIRPELAERWGLRPSTLVSSGGGDNMMGAIGTGNVARGVVTASLGTSGTLYACSTEVIVDPEAEIAAFCDSTGNWLPLACTMNVTVATEMVRNSFFPGDSFDQFDAAIARIQPGSEGLVLLPYLEGERTPDVPQGTGVLLGLRPATATAAHLARASMEGVTLGLRYGLERMKELGIDPQEIRLIGGGSRSPLWRQMVADIFATSVVCPKTEEGAALGAALQAFWMWSHQTGAAEPISDIVRRGVALDSTATHPREDTRRRYDELYELYLELNRTLCSVGGEQSIFSRHRKFVSG